jgi:hypothetical protein
LLVPCREPERQYAGMTDNQPRCSGAPSGLLGTERRTIRFTVSVCGSSAFQSAEFYGLDKARLYAWAQALDGHTAQIAKQVYDTIQSPPKALGSTVVETWDERSTFLILNATLRRP